MNGRRRDVVPADRLARSVTQQTESGSSNSAESSGRNSSPPPIARGLLAGPAKRLRSSTIQTTAYTQPEMEADGKGHMEPVRLSDDSSDEYQSHIRATKLNWTPNLKERTSVVRMRQDRDVVVAYDWWRHTETIAQGRCEFRPTLVHRRQQLSHRRPRPV